MQRYQDNISKLASLQTCLIVISAFNASHFTVSHILPQFKLPITYVHVMDNAHLNIQTEKTLTCRGIKKICKLALL